MTLAYDLRPRATLLVGSSKYALELQTSIRYKSTRQVLCWDCIGWSPMESITQAK